MIKKHRKKKRPLFSPDLVKTRLSQALVRDLERAKLMHSSSTAPIMMSIESQLRDFTKKYIPEGETQGTLESDCFKTFEAVNDHMAEHNLRFVEDMLGKVRTSYPSIQRDTSFDAKVLVRAKSLMKNVLGDLTTEELFHQCKHSGGSTVGVPFTDTSIERKFTYPISMTPRVKSLMDIYLTFDSSLKASLKNLNEGNKSERYMFVRGSRATTVDKTVDKRRMIAVEPTGNMFFQQGLMEIMYERMSAVGLDVAELPDRHKWLARTSSLSRNLATIDWSSASDCVSIELLRWLLPAKWYSQIDRVRSPEMEVNGRFLPVNMISTMGNAVTFPLETLVFWTVGRACKYTIDNPTCLSPWIILDKDESTGGVSVFGDDCIVPTYMAESYMDFLVRVGFIVNTDKSHYGDTPFRESCGGDYLSGYNVRAFNLRAPTSRKLSALEPWLYSVINALLPRYIQYFGTLRYIYDQDLFKCFVDLCRENHIKIKLVPHDFPEDSGVKISFDLERFLVNYPETLELLSPLARNIHGQISFPYLRFRYYQNARMKNDLVRLAHWLKKPVIRTRPEKKPDPFVKKRRAGGYTVAKALTSRWEVPGLEKVLSHLRG